MNIEKIKQISIKCCHDKNAIKYISDVCKLIKDLIFQYNVNLFKLVTSVEYPLVVFLIPLFGNSFSTNK